MEYLNKLHFNNLIFSNITPIFSNTTPKLLLNTIEKKVVIVTAFIFSAIALTCLFCFSRKKIKELQAKKKEQQEPQVNKEQLELQAKNKEQQEPQTEKELQAKKDLTELTAAWASYEKNPESQEDMIKMLNCARNFFVLSRHSEILPKFKELCHQILSSELLPKEDSQAKTIVQLQLKKYLELLDFPIEILVHPAFHGEAYFLAAEQIIKTMKENKVSEENMIKLFPKEMKTYMRKYSSQSLNSKEECCYLLRISSYRKEGNNHGFAVSIKDLKGIAHGIIIYNSDSKLWSSKCLNKENLKSLEDVLNQPVTKNIADFVEDIAKRSTTNYTRGRRAYYRHVALVGFKNKI